MFVYRCVPALYRGVPALYRGGWRLFPCLLGTRTQRMEVFASGVRLTVLCIITSVINIHIKLLTQP